MVDKTAFRRQCRSYREGLHPDERTKLSNQIAARVRKLHAFQEARTIHIFWPIEETGEIDTRPMIRQLLASRRRVVLPVVDFSSAPDPALEHRELTNASELVLNRWGISEPREGEHVPIDEIDLVIVPALGADRTGHRVGYGGGFYDRFLANISVPTIALVYDACLTDRLSAEPHDIQVSIIVTESKVLQPDK